MKASATYAPLEGKKRLNQLLLNVLNKAQAIEGCFEQSFFLLGHIAYLQAFVDVNKRTARLASIIPLIVNDYVPQSFVDIDKDSYLKASLCFYEFSDVRPLAELYIGSYHCSCLHYDTAAQVVALLISALISAATCLCRRSRAWLIDVFKFFFS